MGKSWRDLAINRIAAALLEYEASKLAMGSQPTPEAGRKYVNDRYPFGVRQYSPYNIWLQELRLAVTFLKSGRRAIEYLTWRSSIQSNGTKKGKTNTPAPGQVSLF